MNLIDYAGKTIRLTGERLTHVKEHPEMTMHTEKINDTLTNPDVVIKSRSDEEARLYYKYYEGLAIGNKHLCIVVKFKETDAFVVTAYFTDSVKKGEVSNMEKIKVWYDPEGDYLEVMFETKEGYFRETESDQIMEKVDMEGKVIGFSILKVSSIKGHPLELSLATTK